MFLCPILDGTLQGSIPGKLVGNTTVITRDMGFGIEFDGVTSYVDFGIHDGECFHSPDACTDGVTFSMWIWSERPMGDVVPLDSGGYDIWKAGFTIRLWKNALQIGVKFVGDKGKHRYVVKGWNHNRWQHVVWTCNQTQGIRVFLNGCDTDPRATREMYKFQVLRNMRASSGVPFVLGAKARNFARNAKVKLDDVYVWYQVLIDQEIWMVYANGGMIWWLHWLCKTIGWLRHKIWIKEISRDLGLWHG